MSLPLAKAATVLLLMVGGPSPTSDANIPKPTKVGSAEWYQALEEFHGQYNQFTRRLYGCPAESLTVNDKCFPMVGVFDAKLWKKLRQNAIILFLADEDRPVRHGK